MAKSIPEQICQNVNFPECIAFNIKQTSYASMYGRVFGIKIDAPYTLGLLLISIFLAIRMINHANSLYASIGKEEMKIIYYTYILTNLLLLVLICFGHYINDMVFGVISAIQLAVNSTLYFSIFTAGVTIDRIYGIMRMSSSTFMCLLLVVYFIVLICFSLLSLIINNEYVAVLIILLNTFSVLFYLIIQYKKLKGINSDIWGFGILGIIFSILVISTVLLFTGARLIGIISEKALDNLFFITLLNLFLITMIHKYWSNTCDFEVECLTLDA